MDPAIQGEPRQQRASHLCKGLAECRGCGAAKLCLEAPRHTQLQGSRRVTRRPARSTQEQHAHTPSRHSELLLTTCARAI